MPPSEMRAVLTHMRRIIDERGSGPTDAELLGRYVAARDEAAFELLVWRHGAMVLRTCRRLLDRPEDAEDAFQATFLALVRRAGAIGNGEAAAGWLYRVACRTSSRLLGTKARRASRERQVDAGKLNELPQRNGACEEAALAAELRRVLDDELNRLPARLRDPVILCGLEGMTNAEAARQLGCPHGTLLSRLSRARERLRLRLARRGLTLSAAALTAALAQEAAAAVLPSPLLGSTLKAAALVAAGQATTGVVSTQVAALTQGVVNAMSLTKLKIVLAVLAAVGLAAVGTGGLFYAGQDRDANGARGQKSIQPPQRSAVDQAKADVEAARAHFNQAQANAEAATAQMMLAFATYMRAKENLAKVATGRDQPPEKAPSPLPKSEPKQPPLPKTAAHQPPSRKPSPDMDAGPNPSVPLGHQADLINLATAYSDAVRDLDLARAEVRIAQKRVDLKVESAEALELKQIAVQAAERKVALLRSIAEGALKSAEAELSALRRAYEKGYLPESRVVGADGNVRILQQILGSVK
jgi:RNA polymerase sigma factor (sigma-70 family)